MCGSGNVGAAPHVAGGVILSAILVGLVVALAVGPRLGALAGGGVVASLMWGLAVARLGAFVGGALLAVPNYVVGVLMGLSVRYVVATIATATDVVRRDAA